MLRHSIIDAGYEGASLQEMSDENTVMIRLQPKNASPDEDISIVKLLLSDIDSAVSFRRVDYVGPKVGSELMQKV